MRDMTFEYLMRLYHSISRAPASSLPNSPKIVNYYEVLGVTPNAEFIDVWAAHRDKRKEAISRGDSQNEIASIDEAFKVLGDVKSRMAYDWRTQAPNDAKPSQRKPDDLSTRLNYSPTEIDVPYDIQRQMEAFDRMRFNMFLRRSTHVTDAYGIAVKYRDNELVNRVLATCIRVFEGQPDFRYISDKMKSMLEGNEAMELIDKAPTFADLINLAKNSSK